MMPDIKIDEFTRMQRLAPEWDLNDKSTRDALREIIATIDEQKPEERGVWQWKTLATAYAWQPNTAYLLEGILRVPSLNIVYGAPGTLKSMLMIDLALCVASGRPWLPLPSRERGLAVLASPVLWADFDNGEDAMNERIRAIGQALELGTDTPFYYVSMPSPWLDAADPADAGLVQLRAGIVGASAKLVIVDNLRNIAGKVDENSAEIGDLMLNLRRLSEELDVAIILIHHQRKAQGFKARAGDNLRGHSSIEAALDLALLVTRENREPEIHCSPTKIRGADFPPFTATFAYEREADMPVLARARFFSVPEDLPPSDEDLKSLILEILGEQALHQRAITGAVQAEAPHWGINKIRSILAEMVREKELDLEETSHGKPNCYTVIGV